MLRKIYNRILADTEQDTESDGYLSHRAEWHAATWGLTIGILAAITGRAEILVLGIGWVFTRGADSDIPEYIPYPKQLASESLYMLAHGVATYALFYIAEFIWQTV